MAGKWLNLALIVGLGGACAAAGCAAHENTRADGSDLEDADVGDSQIEQAGGGSPAAECTTGSLYDEHTLFKQGTGKEAETRCIPHCGQEESKAWFDYGINLYGVASLPSGECAADTPPCSMDVGRTCCGRAGIGNIWTNYLCECAEGRWVCEGTYKGGGACAPCE